MLAENIIKIKGQQNIQKRKWDKGKKRERMKDKKNIMRKKVIKRKTTRS